MTFVVAADGSALGNPGPAGWAWYIDEQRWAAGGWKNATNNQGELTAVIEFLQATADQPEEPVHFLCDSQYVINSVTKWMPGWKRNGWRKKDGGAVLNVEMMQRLDELLVGRKVTFEWVKGHDGHELNEKADTLARNAATAFRDGRPVESGPGLSPAPRQTSSPVEADLATSLPSPTSHPSSQMEDNILGGPEASYGSGKITGSSREPELVKVPYFTQPLPPGSPLLFFARLESRLLDGVSKVSQDVPHLHPQATYVDAQGRQSTANDLAEALELRADAILMSELRVIKLSNTAALISYLRKTEGKAYRCTSAWIYTDKGWMLRHHQETPAQ